jgi:hypothetical protein
MWDVHRLVELTKNHPILDIPVMAIHELDENFWFESAAAIHSPTTATWMSSCRMNDLDATRA